MEISARQMLCAALALSGVVAAHAKDTDSPADLQYWLVLIGITGFAIVLTIVGLIQGEAWYNGEALYRTLPMIQPYYVTRAALGLLIVAGAYIGLYNIVRSLYFNRGVTA